MPGHPKSPGMVFDNGTADRKTHAKPPRFCGVKCRKDILDTFWMYPDAGVTDNHHYFPLFASLRLNDEFTCPPLHGGHGVGRIQDQVEENLLYLDAVTEHVWQVRMQLQAQRDALLFDAAFCHHNDLADGLVQIQWH